MPDIYEHHCSAKPEKTSIKRAGSNVWVVLWIDKGNSFIVQYCPFCGYNLNDLIAHRSVMITFDIFERLDNRKCHCGSTEFYRVVAIVPNVKYAGEYSLTLSMCNACLRLFHIV